MRWTPLDVARRIGSALRSAQGSVLVVTVSVQGMVVAAQLVAAAFVEPAVLGRIRWLESAFAITLLATSCGMPSLMFREAALSDRAEALARLLVDAAALTAIASGVAIAAGLASRTWLHWLVADWQGMTLLCMAFALIPANAARIAVAVVQGAQLSRVFALRLAAFAAVSTIGLAASAAWAGATAWVGLRLAVELALMALIWQPLLRQGASAPGPWPQARRRLRGLFVAGLGANYAFLARVLADNLPLLLLPLTVGQGAEVGLYGLANLVMFAPLLLMSTAMQSKAPALIQSAGDEAAFRELADAALRSLLGHALSWCIALLLLAGVLRLGGLLPSYAAASGPLAALALGLPARALVLRAGAAAVAHGWFARSSILTLCEIAVVGGAFGFGVRSATQLAAAVTVALWAATLPAWWIMVEARRAAR